MRPWSTALAAMAAARILPQELIRVVEEGVNAVDSAFLIEYGANEGCP